MMKGLFAVAASLAAGEAVIYLTNLPLPSSVLGLLALYLALSLRWVDVADLTALTDFLMQHLALLLIVPCVALMTHLDMIQADFLPLLGASVISSILLMLVVGRLEQWLHPCAKTKREASK